MSEVVATVPGVDPVRLLRRLQRGSVRNVRFEDMVKLLQAFGFERRRTSGSHQIFAHRDVAELVNLQNVAGEAKPYQVKQILRLIERYSLTLEGEA